MKTRIDIAPLATADAEDWRRLWTAYLRFYDTQVSETVFATTWARLLSGAAGEYRGLIARMDGIAVGIAHFLTHRHCWRVEDVCYLQDLYVDADQRGAGVGRRLIEAVYDAADQAGAPSVYWTTQHFNAEARRLYDRIGMETPFIKYQRPG